MLPAVRDEMRKFTPNAPAVGTSKPGSYNLLLNVASIWPTGASEKSLV